MEEHNNTSTGFDARIQFSGRGNEYEAANMKVIYEMSWIGGHRKAQKAKVLS